MGIFANQRLATWLRRQQRRRARSERRMADTSAEEAETLTHERRADKATYLQEKLEQRERSERADD